MNAVGPELVALLEDVVRWGGELADLDAFPPPERASLLRETALIRSRRGYIVRLPGALVDCLIDVSTGES